MSTATGADLSTPLRDVIAIPERVHADDFVLQLHHGVSAAEQTLRDYVVTGSIVGNVDEALDLVASALRQGRSKGAFVHGSFGAGKSHFMAVTQLLLAGNATARALPGLQDVVARHQPVLGKRYLSISYHLLGKPSFEQALFSGYLDRVAQLHPEAAAPVLHRSDALLEDADRMRQQLGDDSFFAGLGTEEEDAEWGTQASPWSATSYDDARRQGAEHPDRQRLVRDLVDTYFRSQVTTGEYLDIAAGLRAMTAHARGLGYDGVLLFLDELVLWLGQHLSDKGFINRETSKVAKLVETESSDLALPLVSFVARQRNLKDFVAGDAVGAEQVALGQSFQWWEDRFDKITLQAADLPQIVNKRLLTPLDDDGAAALERAVGRVRSNRAAWQHLLQDEAGSSGGDFAQVYPFPPALVDAMIALSNLMQRERTAIKLMSELLSRGRDHLTVGDLIPAGDLFDVVVLSGEQPLTDDMKKLFHVAATFYRSKFRPYLLEQHHLTEEGAATLERGHRFVVEDRLVKTLLVAQIASGARSLKDLTASKLAALNHGTVRSVIPGQEAREVVTLARRWASQFGEITVGAGGDPLVSIALSGVDYDSVLDRVQAEDTQSARRTLIRSVILQELGATEAGFFQHEYRHVWRGHRREADLVFGNVRDAASLNDDAFVAGGGRWKVVIDYPFDDEANHSPSDDVARVDSLRRGTETIVWVPHFLAASRMDEVGDLVKLEYLLTGAHFDENAVSLPVAEREPARRQLTNRRDALRAQLGTALKQAYGVQAPTPEHVGEQAPVNGLFLTLTTGLRLSTPNATTLKACLDGLLDQAREHEHPKHPEVTGGETELKRAELAAVLDLARRAVDSGGRAEGLDRSRAAQARRVVEGYRIGVLRENVFALDAGSFGWWDDFTRWSSAGGNEVSAASLTAHLAETGMTADAQQLLVLVWAALADRLVVAYGTPTPPPAVGSVAGHLVFREPVLPDDDVWEQALRRAQAIFGVGAGEHHRSTASVQRVASGVRERSLAARSAVHSLLSSLVEHSAELGLDITAPTGRLVTARRCDELVDRLSGQSDDTAVLTTLAGFDLPAEGAVVAHSISTAGEVGAAVRGAQWDLLRQLGSLPDGSDRQALDALAAAAAAAELHQKLVPALADATREIVRLIGARNASIDDGAVRRAAAQREEEARRRAVEERERQESATAARLENERLAADRADLERQQREAAAEKAQLDARRREQEEAAERARRAPFRLLAPSATADVVAEVSAALRAALAEAPAGKQLRVTWTWE